MIDYILFGALPAIHLINMGTQDIGQIINTSNSYYARLTESDAEELYKLMTAMELDSN